MQNTTVYNARYYDNNHEKITFLKIDGGAYKVAKVEQV